MNQLKSRRGFSLVELMVVVAIMGTLAAIAIPAYNEYRKSAKKTAYRTDLLSLHKGWMAFGVELDSFCERETTPQIASIGSVGMKSLDSSKLYGITRTADACDCDCSGPPGCAGGTYASAKCTVSGATTCDAKAFLPERKGPGKTNFIGFSGVGAACFQAGTTNLIDVKTVHLVDASTSAPATTQCQLGVTQYQMGVAGHISGANYIGFSVNNDGVVSETSEGTYPTVQGTTGVCS